MSLLRGNVNFKANTNEIKFFYLIRNAVLSASRPCFTMMLLQLFLSSFPHGTRRKGVDSVPQRVALSSYTTELTWWNCSRYHLFCRTPWSGRRVFDKFQRFCPEDLLLAICGLIANLCWYEARCFPLRLLCGIIIPSVQIFPIFGAFFLRGRQLTNHSPPAIPPPIGEGSSDQ